MFKVKVNVPNCAIMTGYDCEVNRERRAVSTPATRGSHSPPGHSKLELTGLALTDEFP